MNEVTRILSAIEQGDPQAAEQLLPLVYDELRKLAAQRLAQEKPGQTLQATALVHEAYLRLLDAEHGQDWNSRGHFFAAAAEAMRRILVDNARRKRRPKHGGDQKRIPLDAIALPVEDRFHDLLALDEALNQVRQAGAAQGGAGQAPLLRGPVGRGGRRVPGHLPDHRQAILGRRPRLALCRLVRWRGNGPRKK